MSGSQYGYSQGGSTSFGCEVTCREFTRQHENDGKTQIQTLGYCLLQTALKFSIYDPESSNSTESERAILN